MSRNLFIQCVAALLLAVSMACPAMAQSSRANDEEAVMQREVRRLHPERERLKAMKKLQEQRSRKATVKADPWDTSDEVWGTVDVPPAATRDTAATVGHRLTRQGVRTSKTPEQQAALDSLLAGDYSITEYGYRRMTWRDLPVTTTVERLLPGFTVEDSDCRSKYVSADTVSNEVYFAFAWPQADSLPGPLRLCVHYCADDPLDFDQLIFTIDGYDYPFYPGDHDHGRAGDGLYWERSDDVLPLAARDLAYALAHSHWVALKLVSVHGIHHVKMLTRGQRQDFADTLDLYRLLGGVIGH